MLHQKLFSILVFLICVLASNASLSKVRDGVVPFGAKYQLPKNKKKGLIAFSVVCTANVDPILFETILPFSRLFVPVDCGEKNVQYMLAQHNQGFGNFGPFGLASENFGAGPTFVPFHFLDNAKDEKLVPFNVVANQVTYVGRVTILSRDHYWKPFSNKPIKGYAELKEKPDNLIPMRMLADGGFVTDFIYQIDDMHKEDIAVLTQKYPLIDKSYYHVDVMKMTKVKDFNASK